MLTIVQRSRLEKVAQDNGFDVPGETTDAWLTFTSTQVPLKIWLGGDDSGWTAGFSQVNVAAEVAALADGSVPPPDGAGAAVQVGELLKLHHLVRRAYQLSSALPDELLREFERRSKGLPRETEVERLVVQRVGQDVFRDGLMKYWEGSCAVTGLSEPELLRASHIKPWAQCATDQERLNVFNGLLLAVHLDAAFDRGFITFDDAGALLISSCLSAANIARLGLTRGLRLKHLEGGHLEALAWHRASLFKRPGAI